MSLTYDGSPLTAPSQATEPDTLTLPLIHFYPHTPLQNEAMVPVDATQQRLCHLFALACMCAHKHTNTHSLSHSLSVENNFHCIQHA